VTPFQAVVLSIVQAVTEFLPISSSGHLILVPRLLGWPDQGLAFDIATNTGTLLAVLLYFRRDLAALVRGFFTGEARPEIDFEPRPMAFWLALGTIPVGLCGLLLYDQIATHARNPLLIAGTAIGGGLLLALADRKGIQERPIGTLGWRDALAIGAAQALALAPGTSRSGITLTAALLLGFTRPAAARFSFLLTIPVGLLAAALSFKDLLEGELPAGQLLPMAIGVVVSAAAGYLVIDWLLGWLRTRSVMVFVRHGLRGLPPAPRPRHPRRLPPPLSAAPPLVRFPRGRRRYLRQR
jgi:undecaprenyl-diphosphatase